MKQSVSVVVGLVLLGSSTSTPAQTSNAMSEAASTQHNPYTVAEFGPGLLALPTSHFLLTQSDTRTRGEVVPYVWIWMLYRVTQDFAVGAGASLAIPFSTEITQRTDEIERGHKRQYLLIDMTGRYYGLRLPGFDGWLGVTVGGAVISDQFKTVSYTTEAVILGPAGVVVRTEGLSAGLTAGFGWSVSQNWTLEASVRSSWWFLPSERACGTTGECATLASGVAAFSLGIGAGYRVSL